MAVPPCAVEKISSLAQANGIDAGTVSAIRTYVNTKPDRKALHRLALHGSARQLRGVEGPF